MVIEFLAILILFGFVLSHSILATQTVKNKLGWSQRTFRLVYNILAVLSFGLLLQGLSILATHADHQTIAAIITPTPEIKQLILILQLIGIIFVLGAWIQTNPLKFMGLLPENPNNDLHSGWFYRFSRHPMYFGVLLIIVPDIFMRTNLIWILTNLIFALYLIVGAIPEEMRMKKTFPSYAMFHSTRGFLFPWKISHFQSLFSKNTPNSVEEQLSKEIYTKKEKI
ncbi:MAG: methyltransferase family protein [Candidatus Heimdallarchaeota archaeon]